MRKQLSLGQKIRKSRGEAKLSQAEVAEYLSVSDKTISSYEADRILPPLDKLKILADTVGKPITYFVEDNSRQYTIQARLKAVEQLLKKVKGEVKEIREICKGEKWGEKFKTRKETLLRSPSFGGQAEETEKTEVESKSALETLYPDKTAENEPGEVMESGEVYRVGKELP